MDEVSGDKLEHLKELVQHHEVCWDVSPVQSATTGGQTLQVGYEVLVSGIFNDPEQSAATVRDKTDVILQALREIAADLAKHAGLPAEHRIKPYDAGIQASPKREYRPEARLKLALLHQEGFHVAVDEKLTNSLQLVECRLSELGAC